MFTTPGRLLIIAIVFSAAPCLAQYDHSKIRHALQVTVDSILQATKTPGLMFACVLPDNSTIDVFGGFADLETKEKIRRDSRMLAGSIGKTFFAALAFKAAEERKLNLDDRIARYLAAKPWFTRLPNADSITVRMLMNHTSGIEEYYTLGGMGDSLVNNPDKVWDHEDQIALVLDREPLFEAGKGWSYADTNYLLLALVLEEVYNNDLFQEIDRLILKPYALDNTAPALQRHISRMTNGYARSGNGLKVEGSVLAAGKHKINPQMEGAGGGFVSCARDLARWAKLYFTLPYVSRGLHEQIITGVEARTGRNHKYGLGMQIRPSDVGVGYGHGGWFPGYLSEMEYFPDVGLAVAIQVNADDFSMIMRPPRAYELLLTRVVLRNMK